jgi:hypothetical protein
MEYLRPVRNSSTLRVAMVSAAILPSEFHTVGYTKLRSIERLTKNPAWLSTGGGLWCFELDAQRGLAGSDMRRVKQRCQDRPSIFSE